MSHLDLNNIGLFIFQKALLNNKHLSDKDILSGLNTSLSFSVNHPSEYIYNDFSYNTFNSLIEKYFHKFSISKITDTNLLSLLNLSQGHFYDFFNKGIQCTYDLNLLDYSNLGKYNCFLFNNLIDFLKLNSEDLILEFNELFLNASEPHFPTFYINSFIPLVKLNNLYPLLEKYETPKFIESIISNNTNFHNETILKNISHYKDGNSFLINEVKKESHPYKRANLIVIMNNMKLDTSKLETEPDVQPIESKTYIRSNHNIDINSFLLLSPHHEILNNLNLLSIYIKKYLKSIFKRTITDIYPDSNITVDIPTFDHNHYKAYVDKTIKISVELESNEKNIEFSNNLNSFIQDHLKLAASSFLSYMKTENSNNIDEFYSFFQKTLNCESISKVLYSDTISKKRKI